MTQQWRPILPTALLANQDVLKVLIDDREVVVWRSASGQAQIWENRCPHRSVRLSLGRVSGEDLVCAYHGWAFAAADGHCQTIPAQPQQRAPKSICSKAYPVSEHNNMIWFGGFDGQSEAYPQSNTVQAQYYAGSLLIRQGIEHVVDFFEQQDFENCADLILIGQHHDLKMHIYLTPTTKDQTTMHAFSLEQAQALAVFDQLLFYRQQLEEYGYELYR